MREYIVKTQKIGESVVTLPKDLMKMTNMWKYACEDYGSEMFEKCEQIGEIGFMRRSVETTRVS